MAGRLPSDMGRNFTCRVSKVPILLDHQWPCFSDPTTELSCMFSVLCTEHILNLSCFSKRCSGDGYYPSAFTTVGLLQRVEISFEIFRPSHFKRLCLSRNFTQFYSTKSERDKNLRKEYDNQMDYRKHLQAFIDRWRYNANRGWSITLSDTVESLSFYFSCTGSVQN